MFQKRFNKIILFIIPIVLFGLIFNIAKAASADYILEKENKGEYLEVILKINSDSNINAAQAMINFDNLEVISVSRENSNFDLWIMSPKYSNKQKYVKFAFGSTTGFSGEKEVLKIKFKIKNASKKINLSSKNNMILLSNGKGTNIYNKTIVK